MAEDKKQIILQEAEKIEQKIEVVQPSQDDIKQLTKLLVQALESGISLSKFETALDKYLGFVKLEELQEIDRYDLNINGTVLALYIQLYRLCKIGANIREERDKYDKEILKIHVEDSGLHGLQTVQVEIIQKLRSEDAREIISKAIEATRENVKAVITIIRDLLTTKTGGTQTPPNIPLMK